MACKVIIWRQGEALPNLGKKIIPFTHNISTGPADDRVVINGFTVKPDESGDFISGTYSEDELDAVHTFGIARYIIDVFEGSLGRPIHWSWEVGGKAEPIAFSIRNNDINARYLKSAKTIELDFFGPPHDRKYYCRSVDIIAHETAHALLDGLKPLWNKSNIETQGLIETFCDLAAMFFITSQLDLCEEVIKETNGDLKKESILTQFGVGYGSDQRNNSPIRSALNRKIFKRNLAYAYDFSAVLTGTLYELLCEMINNQSINSSVTAHLLFETGQLWQAAIINAFDECNPVNSSLSEFALQLTKTLKSEKEMIESIFLQRRIPLHSNK